MGQIYLVRHGQACFGSEEYDRLSPLGLQQARLLGEWFGHLNQRFQHVVSGSMQRHRQTAETCIGALPKRMRVESDWDIDPGFNEYDHHQVLARHWPAFDDPAMVRNFLAQTEHPKRAFQQIFEQATARWMSGEHDADYGESWPAFRARCTDALRRLTENVARSQNIVVFTSGGTIAALCQQVLGLQDRQTAELSWSLVNCSVTKLFYRPDRLSLGYLNNFAHLEWLGEPDAVTYR